MAVSTADTGTDLLQRLQASGLPEKTFWKVYCSNAITYDAFHGRIWRARHKIIDMSASMVQEFEPAWIFPEGEYVVIGDIQLNTTDYDFMALPLAIGKKYLKRPRKLIIAGDLINADAFSAYENDQPTPSMLQETEAGTVFFREYLTVYDEILWILGNHDRRPGKRTKTALVPKHLLKLMTHDPRVRVSEWGHCIVRNSNGYDWRITHGSNYSVNQLVVAEQMAHKYEQNIISHHEHHLAVGWDRFKRYMLINNGGLFKMSTMGYTQWDDSKSAGMQRGFTLLRDGYPTVFGPEGWTNWDMWLGSKIIKAAA